MKGYLIQIDEAKREMIYEDSTLLESLSSKDYLQNSSETKVLNIEDNWFVLQEILNKVDTSGVLRKSILGGEWIWNDLPEIECSAFVTTENVLKISYILDEISTHELEEYFSLNQLQKEKIYPYHKDLMFYQIYKKYPEPEKMFSRDGKEEFYKLYKYFNQLKSFYADAAKRGKTILSLIINSKNSKLDDPKISEAVHNVKFIESTADGIFNHLGKKILTEIIQIMGIDYEASRFNNELNISYKSHGIAFRFDNKNKLSGIWAYNEKDEGFEQYMRGLPRGLSWNDSREEVEKKLGVPDITSKSAGKGSEGKFPFWVSYTNLGIGLNYDTLWSTDYEGKITRVTATLPRQKKQSEEFLMRCDEHISIQFFTPISDDEILMLKNILEMNVERNIGDSDKKWFCQFTDYKEGMDNVIGNLNRIIQKLEKIPKSLLSKIDSKLLIERHYTTTMLIGIAIELNKNQLEQINALGMEVKYSVGFRSV